MVKLNEDLSLLTTIPTRQLDRLTAKAKDCISNAIVEGTLQGELTIEIDIGYGVLRLIREEQGIRYIFVPDSDLEQKVKAAFVDHKSSLTQIVEASLVDHITNAYKDLI